MNPAHKQDLVSFLEETATEEEQQAKSYADSNCGAASHLCSEKAATLRSWIAQLITTDPEKASDPCQCWEEKEQALNAHGFRLSSALSTITTDDTMEIHMVQQLPIERVDGKPLKRSDPQSVPMSFCPFCGGRIQPRR